MQYHWHTIPLQHLPDIFSKTTGTCQYCNMSLSVSHLDDGVLIMLIISLSLDSLTVSSPSLLCARSFLLFHVFMFQLHSSIYTCYIISAKLIIFSKTEKTDVEQKQSSTFKMYAGMMTEWT